ncbi:MAG: TraB/GumN family protein [Bacteroidetes bacterium]|nr:TraB/GumN family protein [Bacteroidota bacterium]
MRTKSLLWKVEGGSLPGASYLFGTMHVKDRRAFAALAPVYEIISGCEAFAAEFHIENAELDFDPSLVQLPDGQRLADLISPKKYQRLRQILLKTTHLDLDHLQRSLPFVVVNLVSEYFLRSDMPEALDSHLWNFAKGQEKALYGIETFAEQMAVLHQISLEEQVKMLTGMCKNIGRFRHYLHDLARLYEAKELDRLYQLVKKNAHGLRHLMIYRRNEIMAARIEALAARQSVFAAIGAAHLSGGKGVLRLLKRNGLRVTPVLE